MPSLYITQPRVVLRKADKSLAITLDDDEGGKMRRRTLLEVESHRLESIVLLGEIHVTLQAATLCLEEGISIAWLTRSGRFRGRTSPALNRSADLRLRQYALWLDEGARMRQAQMVVTAKVANAQKTLEGVRSNYPGQTCLASGIEQLKEISRQASRCLTRDQLLGLEGQAARIYFQAYSSAFRAEIGFSGRQRRPPPDPANALLSLGYVLLGNLLTGLVEARGFDPAIGFFHELRPGRASLALDLLEEFRQPVVDRFVLRCCNLRVLRPDMFEPDPERPGGVRLTRAGLKTFFAHWEKFLQKPFVSGELADKSAFLPLARRQIDRMAGHVRGAEPYEPYRYKDNLS